MNRLKLFGIAALTLACTAPPPNASLRDTGPRDAAARDSSMDGAILDGSLPDGELPDGDMTDTDPFDGAQPDVGDVDGGGDIDGGSDVDAFVSGFDGAAPDAATDDASVMLDDADIDAGPPPDSAACLLPDGGFDTCACGSFGADCSAMACPSGQTCATDACGMHCLISGAPCSGSGDCGSGSACDTSGHCTHTGGGCADSRDCPTGFTCEASACVDRHIACGSGGECPFGFYCAFAGAPVCARLTRPCASSLGCGSLACTDVDGNGTRECNFSGTCGTNADCPAAGDVCEPHSVERNASCGRHGPCRVVGDCASGMACRDLWGDGISECVDAGGTCTRSSDCAIGSVCATPLTGGPPACLTAGG